MKRILIIVGAILLVGLVSVGVIVRRAEHIATVPCGGKRAVVIQTDVWSEIAHPLYYMIHDGRKALLPNKAFFGTVPYETELGQLHFSCISSPDSERIALIEQTNPDIVLVLYDFGTQWSWPHNWDTPREEHRRRAHAMLADIQKGSENVLVLADEVTHSIGTRRKLPNNELHVTNQGAP